MDNIGLGVVGYGYWGPNLVRNFSATAGCTVFSVCDSNPKRLETVKQRHPMVETLQDFAAMLADKRIAAVVIATPVTSHFPLALKALEAGKHVLLEKPLAASVAECQRLLDEASRRNLRLMVDHTFVYTGAVRKMAQLIKAGELGSLYYYDSVRVNLGLFQHDVSVMWDLAVHDLAILDYLCAEKPVAVSATSVAHMPGKPENIAYLTLFFKSHMIAHLHVNWLAPVKVRRTLIGGSKKMVIYDDIEPSEKIRVYDKGVDITSEAGRMAALISYRIGDMWAPHLDVTEALAAEAQEFIRAINENRAPLTDGQTGLRVVRILEAAAQSIERRGQPVDLRAN